jgi:hypothetical protein
MKVEHRFLIKAKCPLGGTDEYATTMTLDATAEHFPLVEAIEEVIEQLTAEPIYQERLTQELADHFDATVETRGQHKGFTTTCEASST